MSNNCICNFVHCIKDGIRDCFCPTVHHKPEHRWECQENTWVRPDNRCCQKNLCWCHNSNPIGGHFEDKKCECGDFDKKEYDYKFDNNNNDSYVRDEYADKVFDSIRSGHYKAQSDRRCFYR
ncbi:MAG: hypothetical protein PHY15_05145 [Eubacteriales bacterium]|nr:hypothetical protein [Eubacteriales bacterium]MDD4474480.1 hypothetical protein [Eubacteriales bacterium]